jgi:hypothetical protein
VLDNDKFDDILKPVNDMCTNILNIIVWLCILEVFIFRPLETHIESLPIHYEQKISENITHGLIIFNQKSINQNTLNIKVIHCDFNDEEENICNYHIPIKDVSESNVSQYINIIKKQMKLLNK